MVCGHCGTHMVGDRITHCHECRRGDLLAREDWETAFARTKSLYDKEAR